MKRLLDTLELPGGLRALSVEQLKQLSAELREELIVSVSTSGGHFASSLGATEITVALHHALNAPDDRIVWDVGHQAYIHKMLTGRRHQMGTIRKLGGLSGFLKRTESPYDSFGAGHAGTSISAAVGMRLALPPERIVAAVIGDGSMTAGMAFEALNHAGALGLKKFIVILNDNEMSISANVGAISWLLSRTLTSRTSTKARANFKNLYQKGYVPELLYRAIDRAEEAAQGFLVTPAMLFESFGFRYIGPVDGHDLGALVQALSNAKEQDGPVVIHASTVKGKGYEPAEEDPITWHGVNPFDRDQGKFMSAPSKKAPTYTSVFAQTVLELAEQDPQVVAITAAMPGGTGLDLIQKKLPRAFVDVGICEQHAVTFAAGLACEGMKPICAIYSTFLQRAYDQVVHDVCIQNLPVVFAMDRAGVVGNDGETHQGVFDIAYLRSIPNMVIMAPRDENMLRQMVASAFHYACPTAIRFPRGNGIGVEIEQKFTPIELGTGEVMREGEDALVIALGPTAHEICAIAERLESEGYGSVAVLDARFVKPLDLDLLALYLPKYETIFTVEDHSKAGGFGSAVLEAVQQLGVKLLGRFEMFGVGLEFVPHGSQDEQRRMNGYDGETIYLRLRELLQSKLRLVG